MDIHSFIQTYIDEVGNKAVTSTFPMDKDYWFDIPEYEGVYQISNFGMVRSLDRRVDNGRGGTRLSKGRVLKAGVGKPGYKVVVLSGKTGKTTKNVHQLVGRIFFGHVPDGTNRVSVDHKDGDKLDNSVPNIRLVSNRNNTSFGKRTDGGTSDCVGVYWRSSKKRYYCKIQLCGIEIHLGTSSDDSELSELYQKALTKYNSDEKFYRATIHNLTPKEKRAYLLA